MPLPPLIELLLLGSITLGASGAILAWRERPEPGAVPLALLLTAQCWWSATLFFRIQTPSLAMKAFWLNVSWIAVPFIPVAWLYFALEYSGNTQYLRRRYVVAVLIIPVVTALLAITNDYHDLLHVSMDLVEAGGRIQLERTFGPWYWVIAGYTYLLGLLGALPLLQFISSDIRTFRGQTGAILVGLLVPWVTNVLFLLEVLPTGAIDPTPIAFSVSGIAYLGALTRFQLFGTSPSPIRPARQSTFERMRDGILVLDRYNHIVDINPEASRILEVEADRLLGHSISDAVPELDIGVGDEGGVSQTVFRTEDGNNAYDITRSRIDDVHGRTVGQLITLHDISDYLRQQQRLEVLNRVYRHNIRSNIQVILGNAEAIQVESAEKRAEIIREKAITINEHTEKVREVLDLFERGREDQQTVNLGAVLHRAVESARSDFSHVDLHQDFRVTNVSVDGVAEDVIWNVVENAAQHNTNDAPKIWIEALDGGDKVTIIVRDNGPGIADGELALLDEGGETPLQHGSGVGLPIIVWGTELIGGEIEFEDNEPAGTIVRLTVPRGKN